MSKFQQNPHKFVNKNGQFRALTVKRAGDTRIASVPRVAERNILLRVALDGVAGHEHFNGKCKIVASSGSAGASSSRDVDAEREEEMEDLVDDDDKKLSQADQEKKSAKDYARCKERIRSDQFWE
eukprot:7247714-Prymnesium_polylepis.1